MWLAYLVPSYIMSGLHYQGSNAESTRTFYFYVSLGLIYLHALHLASTAVSWLVRNTFAAVLVVFLLFTAFFLYSGKLLAFRSRSEDRPTPPVLIGLLAIAGFPLHVDDSGAIGHAARNCSPTWWLTSSLLRRELREDAFREHNHVCKNKQVSRRRRAGRRDSALTRGTPLLQRQRPEIIVQIACPTPNGTAELEYQQMLPPRSGLFGGSPQTSSGFAEMEDAYVVLGCFWLASFLLFWLFFGISTRFFAPKEKVVRSTNKP